MQNIAFSMQKKQTHETSQKSSNNNNNNAMQLGQHGHIHMASLGRRKNEHKATESRPKRASY